MTRQPDFIQKPLSEMTAEEWESLCDGCGLCCQHGGAHPDSGESVRTNVACGCLNLATLRCTRYAERLQAVPHCLKLTPENAATADWVPDTCAYRLVSRGRPLPEWHYLVCGDREEVHRRGISRRGELIGDGEVLRWLEAGRPEECRPEVRFYDVRDGTPRPVRAARST